MKKDIKYLVLGDIHLGHNNNKTSDIIINLEEFFLEHNKDLNNLDIIFLAGDTFDKQLTTKSEEYIQSMEWLTRLLIYCKRYKIKLRILNGTPSHDHDQIEAFSTIVNTLNLEVDYKYCNILEIEHIEDLDIHVLYVPDEWRHEAKVTYEEVKKLMLAKSINKVDIAIMHGSFKYQLPIKDAVFLHDEIDYLNIVKYYINIGHIHNSSSYNRIIAQGSFDRLTHGEEDPKGGVLCNIYTTGTMEFKFLENKRAKIFKTIDCLDKNITELFKELRTISKTLPKHSYLRIITTNDNKLMIDIKRLFKDYPDINIKFKIEDVKAVPAVKLFDEQEFDGIEITKYNIEYLVESRAKGLGYDEGRISKILNKLKDFM